jgi:two-component system sensor histidine kinase MtrB
MEDTKLHNGWLQAWGKKGSGANFRLTLPLRQGEEIDKSPVQLEPEDITIPGETDNRNMLLLEAGGAPLAPASTSKETT